ALVLASGSKFPALLLDLPEEAGVLDRQGGLRGERLQQLDRLARELAGRLAVHGHPADQVILAHQWYRHHRAIPGLDEGVADRARVRAVRDVRHLDRSARGGKMAKNALVALAQWRPAGELDEAGLEITRRPQVELLAGFVVLEDRAAIGPDEII